MKDGTKFVTIKNIQVKILRLKSSSSYSTPLGYGKVNASIFALNQIYRC